uniref:Uncharacterized protein n=1 Tax=Salix viminalis TaxID=40686 RepID=A0A6N2MLB3_SALVM
MTLIFCFDKNKNLKNACIGSPLGYGHEYGRETLLMMNKLLLEPHLTMLEFILNWMFHYPWIMFFNFYVGYIRSIA